MNDKLKLFISYSHLDETKIDVFRKHIAPLKDNGIIEDWYDRKILGGKDFQNEIDNNLADADIICLFISHNFLSSNACKKEITDSLYLKKQKGVAVFSIILSPCAWMDVADISKFLVTPTDGKPISSYADENEGWVHVYDHLKRIAENENKTKLITFSDSYKSDLEDVSVFKKAHPKKEIVTLNDIYVSPDLAHYSVEKDKETFINADSLSDKIFDNNRLIILGDDQSGKTSVAKVLCKELREKRYIPLYISAVNDILLGDFDNILSRAFNYQYSGLAFSEIDKTKIIPIIDDFHKAKNKERIIKKLSDFAHCVLIVDFNIGINIRDNFILKEYSQYKILEIKPSQIDALIRKWVSLGISIEDDSTEFYKAIDAKTAVVFESLGRILGKGIMPSYPFFILSIISTYDTFQKPLDQEITSQGHCYQALILYFLAKQGVRNEDIDYYINFLTEFAYFLFHNKKDEIDDVVFNEFIDSYEERFNSIDREILIDTLAKSQLLCKSSLSNYSFCYPYIYYFFCGRFFSDNIANPQVKKEVENIIENLHTDENAYITIFISHHSKNSSVLDDIQLLAMLFFDKHTPATLSKEELLPFDTQSEIIVQATLPEKNNSERERYNQLQNNDKVVELSRENSNESTPDTEDMESDMIAIELRRCIKTVEVIGHIIKNRAGSIEKNKLEEMYTEAMNVHLRIMSHFFGLIQNENSQTEIIEILTQRVNIMLSEKEHGLTWDQLRKIASKVFWNMNFIVVYSLIDKIVQSLGSTKLTLSTISPVCDKINTPATIIIKHASLMWYNKSMRLSDLENAMKNKEFSQVAINILKLTVLNHCRLHAIDHKNRDKICRIFGFQPAALLK